MDSEFKPYAGRWVAVIRNRIVGQGGDPEQALRTAKYSRHKENPEVKYVPTSKPFDFPPILDDIRKAVPTGIKIFLVGGAVRDALLHRPIHDFDFIVQANSLRVARKVANNT